MERERALLTCTSSEEAGRVSSMALSPTLCLHHACVTDSCGVCGEQGGCGAHLSGSHPRSFVHKLTC